MSASEYEGGSLGFSRSRLGISVAERNVRYGLDTLISNARKGIAIDAKAAKKVILYGVQQLNWYYRYARDDARRIESNWVRPDLEQRIKSGRIEAAGQIRDLRRRFAIKQTA